MKEKNTHGGLRPGSGRKPKDTKQLSLKVPTKIINDLNIKFSNIKERNVKIVELLKKLSK